MATLPDDLYRFADSDEGLPPLHGLRVFAAAARCGTFSAAAKELAVTQSAVSRQVQQLEAYLGVTLFVRHKLGLQLTTDAEALLPVIQDAFGRVARECNRMRNAAQVLTLRIPPTLAIRWFLPRLPSLRKLMPDVDVRMTTSEARQPHYDSRDVDAIIMYGRGNWPNMECIRLMGERLTPVCSPDMAKHLAVPADLQNVPLLQCNPIQAWTRWLEAAGVSWIPSHRQTFDTLEFALSAASCGQGVALGDLSLLKETLSSGVLVAPFECVVDQGISYFLIYSAEKKSLPKIRILREWLVSTVDSAA